MQIPLLLLISGPPGAGKTSLGQRLAQDLPLPFFYKDGIKELLFDALGWSDRQWSRQLGGASMGVLWHILEQQLAGGCSLVAEGNFSLQMDAPKLEALRRRFVFRVLEVHCTAPSALLLERFFQRAKDGQRHPGHVEHLQREEIAANLAAGRWGPISSGEMVLMVETGDFARVDYAAILQRARAALAKGDVV
jgi:predicted kinase